MIFRFCGSELVWGGRRSLVSVPPANRFLLQIRSRAPRGKWTSEAATVLSEPTNRHRGMWGRDPALCFGQPEGRGGVSRGGRASEGVDWPLRSLRGSRPTLAAGLGGSFTHSLEWIGSLDLPAGEDFESELVLGAGVCERSRSSDSRIWLTVCGIPSFLPVPLNHLSLHSKPGVMGLHGEAPSCLLNSRTFPEGSPSLKAVSEQEG